MDFQLRRESKYYVDMMRKYIKILTLNAIKNICKLDKSSMDTSVQRILVVRLDEIGDMVLMSPFLRELRRNYPEAEITLVVKTAVYNLVELCPYVNHIKIFKRPAPGRGMFFRLIWAARKFVHEELNGSYDLALVPRFDADAGYGAGFIALFSKAIRRVGYTSSATNLKFESDAGYDALYTELVPIKPGIEHEVERDLDVLRYLGRGIEYNHIELWTNKQDKIVATNLFQGRYGAQLRLVVLLSAGGRRKEWDVKKFIEVVKRLKEVFALEIVLLGAGEPADTYGEIFQKEISGSVNLINQCTLRETYEIMKQCQFVLGNDTGPMHMAAAAGLRGVALYLGKTEWAEDGLDTPERFGPWQSNLTIIQPDKVLSGCEHGCRETYAHCINQIRVDDVVKHMESIVRKYIMEENQ